MTNSSLLLTFLYVAIALLLLVLCLATAWKRSLKILMIVVVTVSYFAANYTFEDMLGWPTPRMLPEKFAIVSAVIEEPNKERGIDGAIYLWVTPLDSNRPVTTPRAYKLPYMRALHEKINEGMKKGKMGISQMGTAEPKSGLGKGPSWLNPGKDEQEIKILDVPAPQVPEK